MSGQEMEILKRYAIWQNYFSKVPDYQFSRTLKANVAWGSCHGCGGCRGGSLNLGNSPCGGCKGCGNSCEAR